MIEIAEHAGREEELIRFLQMARKKAREPLIDTEYAYCLAKSNRLADMEEFLGMTNVADILQVGEKCFNEELYEAAKVLFSSIANYARLATTLVYLKDFTGAVEAARKVEPSGLQRTTHIPMCSTILSDVPAMLHRYSEFLESNLPVQRRLLPEE